MSPDLTLSPLRDLPRRIELSEMGECRVEVQFLQSRRNLDESSDTRPIEVDDVNGDEEMG